MPLPTQKEIARACGVNASTVSRALANQSSISPRVRKRIQSKAREMGWRPNPLVSAHMAYLRSSRQTTYKANIAFVVATPEYSRFDELTDYMKNVYHGAKERAGQLGYLLELIWMRDLDDDGARLNRLLTSRGIPGLIIYGLEFTRERYPSFDWDAFSIATWGVGSPGFNYHLAMCNNHHVIPIALEKIREYGYKKIGLMLSRQQDDISDHGYFSSFYHMEHHHHEDEWLKSLRLPTWDESPALNQRIAGWIDKHQPSVIIGEGVVWRALERMKLRVPDDMAFVSPFWSASWPHVAGVDHLTRVTGANALDLVASQLIRNERGVPAMQKFLMHDGIWRDGASLPDRRGQ